MTQITIAAAHKLAERLQRDIDVKQSDIAQLARPLSARVPSDADRVIDLRSKFKNELDVLDVMNDASIALALKISQANDKAGLNDLLKERNLLTKKQAFLNGLLRQHRVNGNNGIEHSQAADYFERLKNANSTDAVNINVIADHTLENLDTRHKTMSSRLDQLNDEISRINHSTMLTLDLPKSHLALLGK